MNLVDPASAASAALDLGALSDRDVSTRHSHSQHVQRALGELLQKPRVEQADLHRLIADAMQEGVLSHGEATHLLSALPRDPVHLHAVLTHLHEVASHAGALLNKEMSHRFWGGQPGQSRRH